MSKDFLIQRKRLLPTLSEPIVYIYYYYIFNSLEIIQFVHHLFIQEKIIIVLELQVYITIIYIYYIYLLAPNGYHKANLDKPVDILPIITRNGPNHPLNTVIGSLTNKTDFIDEIPSSPIKTNVNRKDQFHKVIEKDNIVHAPSLFQNILNIQHFISFLFMRMKSLIFF